MSASRIGRTAWTVVRLASNQQRGKSTKAPAPKPKLASNTTPLPKRTNPHLQTLKSGTSNPKTTTTTAITPPKAIAFFSLGVLIVGTYTGYLYATYNKEIQESQSLNVPHDVSDRYNHTAPRYDSDVDVSETVMRLGRRRRELVRMARGDVLEVSCGTGRNLEYYEFGERRAVDERSGRGVVRGCRSVLFVDLSEAMVEVARRKFERLYGGSGEVMRRVGFWAGDAGDIRPGGGVGGGGGQPATTATTTAAKPSKPYFDTIVQTMGICSMADPVATLRHLGSITEPVNGRILLLEHGRSYYDWVNRILDNLAPAHADRHGCWWNRDIGEIVRQSGLEVVEEKRWHLGTTWRYVLRVKMRD